MHTQGESCEDEGRDWSGMSSQRMPKIAGRPPEAREARNRNQPCGPGPSLDLGLTASVIVWLWYGRPRKGVQSVTEYLLILQVLL